MKRIIVILIGLLLFGKGYVQHFTGIRSKIGFIVSCFHKFSTTSER